jgi:hypothetical protein
MTAEYFVDSNVLLYAASNSASTPAGLPAGAKVFRLDRALQMSLPTPAGLPAGEEVFVAKRRNR